MAIIGQSEPAGGRKIIHRALRQRTRKDHPLPLLRNLGQTGAPLPNYRISPKGIAHPRPLSQAKKIGWRYPIVNGGLIGLACLIKKSDHLEFAGISDGQFPERLFEAATIAEEQLRHLERKFQPRLLEIPSLHLHMLWLFSPRRKSRFISLADSLEPFPPSLLTMGEFEALIRGALVKAEKRLADHRAGSRKAI